MLKVNVETERSMNGTLPHYNLLSSLKRKKGKPKKRQNKMKEIILKSHVSAHFSRYYATTQKMGFTTTLRKVTKG